MQARSGLNIQVSHRAPAADPAARAPSPAMPSPSKSLAGGGGGQVGSQTAVVRQGGGERGLSAVGASASSSLGSGSYGGGGGAAGGGASAGGPALLSRATVQAQVCRGHSNAVALIHSRYISIHGSISAEA